MPGPIGLDALEAQVRQQLDWMAFPAPDWVKPLPGSDGDEILDCAIVGGGQYGLALSFGLRRERVDKVRVYDANPAGREGPWVTFARMDMLRTPKHLTNVDLGYPALTFRAWYEAQHGPEGWGALYRIPRSAWMEYLIWYRTVLDLPVVNDTRVVDITPVSGHLLRLTLESNGMHETVLARTVIIASGAEGAGGRNVPAIFDALPADRWAHVNDAFDVAVLDGKRVGVLGSGASAFDIAVAAIGAGAVSAEICFRRAAMPTQNPRRAMENAGFLHHYPDLPDAQRWGYMRHLYTIGQPPPEPTWNKAMATEGLSLHPATPWQALSLTGDGAIRVDTGGGQTREYDFVIAATGHLTDLATRPELGTLAPDIALWRDRYTPPPELAEPKLEPFPYLGRYGEFTEKVPGAAPWLQRVFTITRGAVLSLGPVSASGSNMKYTAPRLIAGVTRQLFLDNANAQYEEIVGNEWHELAEVAAAAAE